jgi:oligopeptide/dipeptide ABC transporter ATP-binding protein
MTAPALPPSPRTDLAPATVLSVRDLRKHFDVGFLGSRRVVRAVDGVSFEVARGETLGLVGESGCGKSTVARCVLRLTPVTSGSIEFAGTPINDIGREELRRLRARMQIVFQDPGGSLNPRMLVRETVAEPLRLHEGLAGRRLRERLEELMTLVGLEKIHLERYPHQLSGGQRQRVGIARAIATNPEFIVLDEPTSSLDVSVQGQILLLLLRLQEELGLSYLFISHDLSVIRHVCQRVAVMYLGRIAEVGPAADIFGRPQHPYTRALLSSVPSSTWGRRRERLRLGGEVPSPINLPAGCRLSPRCPLARSECSAREPELKAMAPGHEVACYAATGWPEA